MFDDADKKLIGELVDQALQTFAQSHGLMSGGSKIASETVMADVGSDERYKKQGPSESSSNYMNLKRTYDLHQSRDDDHAGRSRLHFDAMHEATVTHYMSMLELSQQNLSNTIEQCNVVNNNAADQSNLANGQKLAHRDIATNEQWNLSEQNWLIVQALRDQGVDASIIAKIMESMASANNQNAK